MSEHMNRRHISPRYKFTPEASMEANITKVFDYLKVSYGHHSFIDDPNEPLIFHIDGRTHTPSFFLVNNTIVDVRSVWDNTALMNSLALANEDQINYHIIDSDIYYSLAQKYSETLIDWVNTPLDDTIIPHNNVKVVGITYGERKKTVGNLRLNDTVIFKRDANNQFDKNAILVFTEDEKEIGFLAKEWASVFSRKIDLGMVFEGIITKIESKVITIKMVRSNPDEYIVWDFLREKN